MEIKVKRIGNYYGYASNFAGTAYDENGLSPTIRRPTGGNLQPIFKHDDGGWYDMKRLGRNVPKQIRRFRRLTPLETWRLMAFEDEDFYHAKYGRDFPCELMQKKLNRTCTREEWKTLYRYLRNPHIADTQLYSQAGNSIGVNVLVAIFGQMFEGHERDYEKLYFDRYEKEGAI